MQRTKSKILSILLSLVMLLSLLPTTALAASPDASNVYVNGNISFYNPTRLYYKNGDSDASFTGTSTDFNAAYDPATGTLTLKDYNGKGITVGGVGRTDITVVLKGTNIINDGSLENAVGGDITVTSSDGGTLSITRTLSGGNAAIGIETGLSASYTTGNVTIKGNAKVTINMTNNGMSTYENAKGRKEMAIFITGDTHGDFSRLLPAAFHEQRDLTKEDYLIICGDFGGVWDGGDAEQQWLDWLETRSFTTLFVSGNHENYDLLRNYPISQWHGGLVQAIRPSVLHLMRGQLYNICGKRIFTMGGASSHDIRDGILEPDNPDYERKLRQLNAAGALYRVNHRSWWKEELPGEDEYRTAREALDKTGWDLDYIITHCCPSSIQDTFSGGLFQRDALTDFLDEVRERCRFQYWFFGHYHENMVVEKEFVMLYNQIIRLK